MQAGRARSTDAPINIRAIVFDLGGVLFTEGKSVAVAQLAREHGYNPELVNQILYSPKSLELRKGLIADHEFWSWAQKQLPKDYDAALMKDVWYHSYILDEDIFELIKNLLIRGKYRIIAFSGNIKSRIDFLEERYSFRRLFDQEVYSFDHHVTKPEKKFVEVMVREARCKPEEIVYIDDNDQFTEPARDMGVRVLIYARGEVKKLKQDLVELGV